MGVRLDVPVLHGSLVRLEPLAVAHAPDLASAAGEDRSSYGFTQVPATGEVAAFVEAQLARGAEGFTPFAQVRVYDGRAVGCTALWNPRAWPGRQDLCAIEVGWTWLGVSAQGTGVNVEAKLLLFTYAFEVLRVARVDLRPMLAMRGRVGDRAPRGALGGGAALLVAVAGAGRRGDAAGLGDVLRDRRRVASRQVGSGRPRRRREHPVALTDG